MQVTKTYFMLMVADMDRAVAFYQQVFGLAQAFTSPEWSELQAGGATVALHGGGSGGDTQTGLGFEVDDLEAACAAVTAAGGRIVRQPEARDGEGIRLAEARDTEGNTFSLAQPIGSLAQPSS
jgi:predicted enzyme related to lactoylglutathione lyase